MIDQLLPAARSNTVTALAGLAHELDCAGYFVLEDHVGHPIDCPVCGAVDRWRLQVDSSDQTPRGFVCQHVVATANGPQRRLGRVDIQHVGGYLDLASLLPSAA